jgi:hypothetical protein
VTSQDIAGWWRVAGKTLDILTDQAIMDHMTTQLLEQNMEALIVVFIAINVLYVYNKVRPLFD